MLELVIINSTNITHPNLFRDNLDLNNDLILAFR